MNERTRELMIEAGLGPVAGFEAGRGGLEYGYEKFAELIVKECAELFPRTFTDEQYQRRIDKTILKHFGVME